MHVDDSLFAPPPIAKPSSIKPKFSFVVIRSVFDRYKKLFAVVFLCFWLMSSVYTALSFKPTYTAKGVVLIKDTAVTAKYVTGDSYDTTTSQSTSSVINTMGLLKTSLLKQKLWKFLEANHPEVLNQLKIKNYESWDGFFGNGSKFVKYANIPGTDLITMEFKWYEPQLTQEGLEALMQAFRNASLEINQTEQGERNRFLSEQIVDIDEQLTALREQLSAFKEAHAIVNADAENSELEKVRLEFATNLVQSQAQAKGHHAQATRYNHLLGMTTEAAVTASALGRNELLSRLYSELYALKSERAKLATLYQDNNVKILEIDNHVRGLQKNIDAETNRVLGNSLKRRINRAIADETRSGIVSQLVQAQTQADNLNTQNRVLNSYLARLNSRAKLLPKIEATLARYQLEEASLDNALKVLKEKEVDARLRQSQSLSNVFIIEHPELPNAQSFPKLPHLLFVDLLLALGLASGVVYLVSRFPQLPTRSLPKDFLTEKVILKQKAFLKPKEKVILKEEVADFPLDEPPFSLSPSIHNISTATAAQKKLLPSIYPSAYSWRSTQEPTDALGKEHVLN
jgi:uncharacterized protein involved in exopolysaccharide biosynthesis